MMIVFRVDASHEIGAGHLMRCLTLANAFKLRDVSSRFICRHIPDYLIEILKQAGHEVVLLPSQPYVSEGDLAHATWLGVTQESDAKATVKALADITCDWLVVDHYALDIIWERTVRAFAKHILVIDDIADRQHDCDILLDQNLHQEPLSRYLDKVPTTCLCLFGPKFAILREDFLLQRDNTKVRCKPVNRILVYFGGFDRLNLTTLAVKALTNINLASAVHVDVVIGKGHLHLAQIEALCSQAGFILHVQTSDMAAIMASADLSIGAGGVSTWERCCLGLPTIAICVADNQESQLENAASNGLLYYPDLEIISIESLSKHIATCIENPILMTLISQNSMDSVDGKGVKRLVRKMGIVNVHLRLARLEDSLDLYNWRNQAHVRASSRYSDVISRDTHDKWFADTLKNPQRCLLIGEYQRQAVGVVRFDIDENEAEVSIYLTSIKEMPVGGSDLLESAEQWLKKNRPEIHLIRAHVLGENHASTGLFLSAGYQLDSKNFSKRIVA